MNPPAGWFPDPGGQPGQRYFDGQRWTEHFTPSPPAAPPPPQVAVAVSTGRGVNHALHAVLTLFTCGLWLPVWILCAIFGSSSGSATAVVAGGCATVTPNRKPLIVGAVLLGWCLLGVCVTHPWLLLVVLPLAAGVGPFVYARKADQARVRRELDEQLQRDIIAGRAEYEDRLYYEGDPHGTYGRYMPPPPFDRDQGAS